MGRTRQPTELLKLTGNERAIKRAKREPKPKPERPACPVSLSSTERRIFNATVEKIESLGLIANTDGAAIGRYAIALARFNRVKKYCDANGLVYESGSGRRRAPESVILNETEQTLLKLEREFGLTPSGRAGLQIERPQPESLEAKYGIA